MRYTHTSLTPVRGLSPSSPPQDEEIYADLSAGIRALLTSEPDRHCTLLDQSRCLAEMILTPLVGQQQPGTVFERLEKQVAARWQRRAEKFKAGVFLHFEASGSIDPIAPHTQRDCGEFLIGLDGLPLDEIRARHEGLIRKLLAAVSLGIPSVRGFQEPDSATVFFDDRGKPLFGFNFHFEAARFLVSRRLSNEDLALTRKLAVRLAPDAGVERVVRLLNDSLVYDQDPLRRFLSAWMSLEVFVNTNFAGYEARFWSALSEGLVPPLRERYLKRIQAVMGDKYRLTDKFVVISAELDPSEADADITTFERAKRLRDGFSHGDIIDEADLPLDDVQDLIRRLLRLHITRP